MSLTAAQESLALTLTQPSPQVLWRLRGDLLAAGMPHDAPEMGILNEFYHFVNDLVASSTAREYSHFASILDMAAVGGVAIQNLLEESDTESWWRRMVIGAISEVMMVMAARQYVKAWESEMQSNYNAAAWYLGEELWRLSNDMQPELPAGERRQLVERLIAPINDQETSGMVKAALIVHFYQLSLILRLNMRITR